MKKVYLSGPIFQIEDPKSWRLFAADQLPKGWKAIDPTKFNIDKLTCTELVKQDLEQLNQCQAVIAKTDLASWGTAIEIAHAYNNGIPVLAWPCFLERAPWLTAHVTEFFGSLQDAIAGLKNYA